METNKLLEVGAKAPDFTLPDAEGNPVSLVDFAGKKVVLYFYPKDNTPGCTRQACAFAGAFEEFRQIDAVVIGISKDSAASHKKFAEKYDLPFILLSDPELTAIQSYGVWQEKKLYGKVSMGVVRSAFVVDENGIIGKVMHKVKPDTNAAVFLEVKVQHEISLGGKLTGQGVAPELLQIPVAVYRQLCLHLQPVGGHAVEGPQQAVDSL